MSILGGSGIPILKIKCEEKGTIRDIKKMIARIDGLPNCLNGELLDMGDGVRGLVMGYDQEAVLALVLGDENRLRLGGQVRGVSEPFVNPVGRGYVGRTVTALGVPCDGGDPIIADEHMAVFRPSPPITARAPVDTFFNTGTKIVDAMIPIGGGQRQLIVGDRMTGKTVIALDAIISQSRKDTICIYCCVGKSLAGIEKAAAVLQEHDALERTIVMAAFDSSPPAEQYILPFYAATMADYFTAQGEDVLLVVDDISKHAWAYRQLSLLLERPPGREAYPGDIFYVHTQLLERAGRFNETAGGASMTMLVLVETLQGDLTGYIPSNMISMCDGMVYLDTALYNDGVRPAVDYSQSVSIVGGRAQPGILRKLAMQMRLEYASYRDVLSVSRLQGNLSEEATKIVARGEAISTVIQQDQHIPCALASLVLQLYAVAEGHLDPLSVFERKRFCDAINEFVGSHDVSLLCDIEEAEEMTDDIQARMGAATSAYFEHALA
jgi:F-type H+-transporting ATPase subunit alpha